MKTQSIQNKRKDRDIMKLLMSNYEVSIDDKNKNELYVKFHGPKNSPYEGVSNNKN
jgi:ubiquitin-conjugating enzyme E2 H